MSKRPATALRKLKTPLYDTGNISTHPGDFSFAFFRRPPTIQIGDKTVTVSDSVIVVNYDGGPTVGMEWKEVDRDLFLRIVGALRLKGIELPEGAKFRVERERY